MNNNIFILIFRLSTIGDGSLLISEVQPSDAGKYECSAQSMAGTRTAKSAVLKVLAPPTILREPQESEVIEGDGLDLPCEVIIHELFLINFILNLRKLKCDRFVSFVRKLSIQV